MFLKRRFSKAASRKGKTAYKFKFTFELANLTGIPANVHHAALTFTRGAKTQTSAVAPVEECAAVWHDARSSRLEFVATLYKDASGAFQTKQYALKAQGVTGAVDGAAANHTQRRKTFAKSVLDLASFAALDGTGLDADAELQYVPLESCTKGMPGTVAGMSVQCAWLRDAEPGEAPTADSNLPGSIRAGGGSEATELVFVGEPAAGFPSHSDEQDLEGFKGVDDDADVTDEFPGAFPELPSDGEPLDGASLYENSGASLASRLAPVREGTPGRELASPSSSSSPPRPRDGENSVPAADITQEVGAFAHEAERDVRDVAETDTSPYESQSEDRATPARVLVRRATAALRDEADALRLKLAEAVTRAAVAESDATEHAAHARAAREELRASAVVGAVVEEKARAFEAECAALKLALAASEARGAAKDAALAAAEARAAEEALALSREAAEAAAATERATKESAAHRRRAEKAEAEAQKLAAKAERALDAGGSSAGGEEAAELRRALEAARVRLSAAAAETAAATRAKDELRAECVTLRHALKQSELALKTADASKREAVAAAIEKTQRKSRTPLRETNGAEVDETSAKQTAVMKKLVEKLRADSRLSEASAAKAAKALAFETSARKDAEARAEDAAARAIAAEAEAKKATVHQTTNRTCSILGW